MRYVAVALILLLGGCRAKPTSNPPAAEAPLAPVLKSPPLPAVPQLLEVREVVAKTALRPHKTPEVPDDVTFHKAVFLGEELVAVGLSGKDSTTGIHVRREGVWTRVATDLPRVTAILATDRDVYLGTPSDLLRYSDGAVVRLPNVPAECLGGDAETVLVGGPDGVLSDVTDGEPRQVLGSLEKIRGLARQDDLVWIAGRKIDPKEGIPVDHATAVRRADFMMGKSSDPAGMSYAPGYFAAVDLKSGETRHSWSMPEHRPVEAFVHGGQVYFLSEGNSRRGFNDGRVFRLNDSRNGFVSVSPPIRIGAKTAWVGDQLCVGHSSGDNFRIECIDGRGAAQLVAKGTYYPWAMVASGKELFWYEPPLFSKEARRLVSISL